ncbi:MAG TPA: alcohol dehydrogenase catalytic domain-containing protein [Candidatus Acidoferrales bacterium]|nr:alcohol dehydrogenase catalytic domain-containing protein [Candidatus Acidoferrales bacterium]
MRALVWDGESLRLAARYPDPRPLAGRARVRVRLAGICATDLQIFGGYMGFRGVPGHELVGEVESGPGAWLGKRVVGEINFACGACELCARGLGRHCPNRTVMGILGADGCFADLVSIPVANLHAVPASITDEEAVFAEPLAAAFEILEQVQLDHGHEVLVMGDGKLGMLCAQVLRLTGARVTVLGKHAEKLALVKRTGVRTVLLADWKPRWFDVVVEATGSDAGLRLALEAVRPRGTLVLKSTIAGAHNVSLAPLVVNEITVVGSRCGPFPPALEALAEKRVSVTPWIEGVYRLDRALDAVAHGRRRGARKILLQP